MVSEQNIRVMDNKKRQIDGKWVWKTHFWYMPWQWLIPTWLKWFKVYTPCDTKYVLFELVVLDD